MFKTMTIFRNSILSGLVCLGALASASFGQEPRDLLEVLSSHRRSEHSQAEVAQALAALQPNPVPLLFDMHRRGPEVFFHGEQIDVSKYWCTPDLFSALAFEALVRCPSSLVLDYGSRRMDESTELGERLALTRVLGRLESSASVPLLHGLLLGLADAELASRAVQSAWKEALGNALAKEPLGATHLKREVRKLPPHKLAWYVHAARAAERPECIDLLFGLWNIDEGLDVIILHHMTEIQARFPWYSDERVSRTLIDALEGDNPALQRQAIRGAGRLRLVEAGSLLLRQLESPDPGLRRLALDSLRLISSNRFQRADADWAGWLSEELIWWQDQAPALFDILGARSDASLDDRESAANQGFDALRKLARHPLFANAIAVRVGQELTNMESDLAQRAMQLLVVLDSRVVYPELIEQLDDAEEPRRQAAQRALVRLSGQQIEPERKLWEAYARL